jgi:diadenosine tetraphosphatase ApaH/serine/threonine PP2A family protein phosphatase
MLQLLRKRVVDSDPSVSQLAYPPEPESSSITLDAASLTRGTVSDVVQRLCTDPDARLHPTALKLALDSAASAAGQDRTVVDLTDRTMVSIVGDLHGCALSLRHVMGIVGAPSESSAIVFNGDFVDRGANGVEVLASLALLKACHPRDVVLLRGNHEDELLATAYGFKDELTSKYPGQAAELWDAAVRLFAALPLGATAPEAFIVHGGLPSEKFEIATLARLGVAERRLPSVLRAAAAPEGPSAHAAAEQLALMQGVLWSDPAHGRDHVGVKSNDSRGGTGCLFAEDVSRAFLQREGLRFLIRSHQVVEEGYERTVLDEPTTTKPSSELTKSLELLTVFSAAAYPNGEGANKGAVLRLRAAPVHGAVSGAGARAATLEPVTFQLHGASRQDRDADARRSLGALIRSQLTMNWRRAGSARISAASSSARSSRLATPGAARRTSTFATGPM